MSIIVKMVVEKTTPITQQTLFELGSITKTFVGLLLSEQALSGDIKFNNTLSLYVPRNYSNDVKKITFLGLATHTSGRGTLQITPQLEPLVKAY